jgi:hypothetical protein
VRKIEIAQKLTTGEKRFFAACAFVIVAGLLAMLFVFQMNGGTPNSQAPNAVAQTVSTQQSLAGDWTTVSNGVKMTATVKDSTIDVVMQDTNVTVTWWKGSFDATAARGDTIASLKTPDDSIIMVGGSEKMVLFVVGDKTLSFDASMMGVTKHITLTHV